MKKQKMNLAVLRMCDRTFVPKKSKAELKREELKQIPAAYPVPNARPAEVKRQPTQFEIDQIQRRERMMTAVLDGLSEIYLRYRVAIFGAVPDARRFNIPARAAA
jgi:hypothetical protein